MMTLDEIAERIRAKFEAAPKIEAMVMFDFEEDGTILYNGTVSPATDYLRMFALVVMGFMWARMARVALDKIAAGAGDNAAFYQAKLETARFFFDRMFLEYESRYRMAMAGKESLIALKAEDF